MTTGALPYGDAAVLVELDDLGAVRRLDDALRAARRAGGLAAVVDVVPAARTVLLRLAGPVPPAVLDALVHEVDGLVGAAERDGADAASAVPAGRDGAERPVVELPVVYDGIDLTEVAAATGLAVDEVVRRHRDATYTVAFGGFMPGFAYLVGLDDALRLPRRPTPRERVPAGSVAIADEFTAVYPAATPGGWHLVGRCPTALFDVDRDPPALLVPGARVRFVERRRP